MAQFPVEVRDDNFHDIVMKLVTNDDKISKGSNLQNIPARSKEGARVRGAFKPQEGWFYLAADLSQIEPRIMAHIMWTIYGDNSLRSIFTAGRDLYTTMAMMVFNLDEKYCVDKAYDPTGTFKPRAMMKTGVLAKSYDQQVGNFCNTMGVSIEVGNMFYEKFDTAFPSFINMVRDKRKFAYDKGYSETLYGRKRRFPQLAEWSKIVKRNERKLMDLYIERARIRKKVVKSRYDFERLDTLEELIKPMAEMRNMVGYWERASFNSVIQGTGADILKLNMIRLYRECQKRGWYLNASIHDEIKVEVPRKDLTLENCDLITDIMTKSVELSLPLKSDTVIETVWGKEYDPSEWDFENACPKVA
ncbi:DNA polymerase [Bacillus mycoides]|uniref:DNA-directed DNA polymerase n=1 Tax=Bacillus mycoides (strain KBAB4) TaxID=315730 RepID=A9VVI5_BACMK|nr:DNA polymerase [Bacillus mycoides]ABY46800.1 DNA-directed DNA polymerase [Bacillus mycoides KBAB4]